MMNELNIIGWDKNGIKFEIKNASDGQLEIFGDDPEFQECFECGCVVHEDCAYYCDICGEALCPEDYKDGHNFKECEEKITGNLGPAEKIHWILNKRYEIEG